MELLYLFSLIIILCCRLGAHLAPCLELRFIDVIPTYEDVFPRAYSLSPFLTRPAP